MKRFIVQFREGVHINVPADRMELKDSYIFAYAGEDLVAFVDIDTAVSAHLSEKEVKTDGHRSAHKKNARCSGQ